MKNFRLNWGWSILLVYVTFMLVFLFYFWRSFKELESNEVVTQDYYKKELNYGDVLARKKNADTMKVAVQIINTEQGLEIKFPKYISKVEGKIVLYKPDNAKLDREIPLHLDTSHIQKIENKDLVPGRWNVTIEWKSADVPYLIENKMTLK